MLVLVAESFLGDLEVLLLVFEAAAEAKVLVLGFSLG